MQPIPYSPTRDFSQDEADQVAGRSTILTAALDTELDNIAASNHAVCTNLAIIQRDDGNLRDRIVTISSLATETASLMAGRALRGQWVTATAYALGDVVSESGVSYLCTLAHTSGTFAADLAANKWGAVGGVSTSTIAIQDVSFSILGSADATKIAKFEVDGISPATTRTYTLPDTTGTLALLERAQTFTATQTFSGNVVFNGGTFTLGAANLVVSHSLNVLQTLTPIVGAGAGQIWQSLITNANAGSSYVAIERELFALNGAAIATLQIDSLEPATSSAALTTLMRGSATVHAVQSTGNVTTAEGYSVAAPVFTSTGVIATLYGFRTANLGNAKVATSIAFQADDHTNSTIAMRGFQSSLSAGTGKYNAYFDGTATNYLNGMTLIGAGATSSLTSARLQIFEPSDASLDFYRYAADVNATWLRGIKSRNATINNHTVVQNGDNLLLISAYGSDGTAYQQAAQIGFSVDGVPGAGDMPGRITFSTSPDGSGTVAECARFTNYGSFRTAKRIEEKQGAAVNSANNLTLGSDGNYFQINNNTQINILDNTNWQGGSIVTLKFNSTPTVKHNQAASTTWRPIMLVGAADFVATANDTLTLRYDSTDQVWYEVARAVI